MRHTTRRTRIAASLAGAAVFAATAGGAAVAFAGTASATPIATASSTPGDPVLVGPLLNLLAFGDNIGIPLACGTAAAAIGDGASQYGLAKEASGLINALNNGCATISAYGAKFIALRQADDSGAAALAPVLDPALTSMANSVQSFATTFGSALNPFGQTIYGSGATILWVEGGK